MYLSVIFNPGFDYFGADFKCRRFKRKDENDVTVDFIDPLTNKLEFHSTLRQYSVDDYHTAAIEGGFAEVEWKNLFATSDSIARWGEDFWKLCHERQPYTLLVARKHTDPVMEPFVSNAFPDDPHPDVYQ